MAFPPVLLAMAVVPAAHAAKITPIDPSPYALSPTGSEKRAARVLDRIGRRAGRASLSRVLARANHPVRPLASAPVPAMAGGFRWTDRDEVSPDWYPQGITTLQRGGRARGLIVSWYSPKGQGARVSFIAQRVAPRYRHVLLVQPVRRRGRWRVERVQTHAGGIAAVGRYLYVADTWNGMRVFDLGRMMRARGGHRRAGYRYVLPQVQRYAPTPPGVRFSFVSVDRSQAPNSLITGEFRRGEPGGRLFRWGLHPRNGRITPRRAQGALSSPVVSMQGGLSLNGRVFVTSSRGQKPGSLVVGAPGQNTKSRRWPVGPEALTYSPATGLMYSLTEYPGQRTVFAVSP